MTMLALLTRPRDPMTGRYRAKGKGTPSAQVAVQTTPVKVTTSVVEVDPYAVIQQYDRLIHKMARACQWRLPPGTAYEHEDLYQEGAIQVLRCLAKYDPDRGVAKFMTYLTVSLKNRYGLIVHNEWTKRGWHDDDPDDRMLHEASPRGDQAEVDVLLDWARTGAAKRVQIHTPHRYREWLPARATF